MHSPAATPSLADVKARQHSAWSSGDYSRVGVTLQIVGEQLAEAMQLRPDAKVLDVAAGNGNASLAFARRFCKVTSSDYVEGLLQRGAMRAAAEGLELETQLADAENLPFADGSFDAVASTFGVMFAPDQERAASEMLRVCRSGGHIGLANWTASSFIGELFGVLGKHLPPPPGVSSPARWGNPQWLQEQFGASATAVTTRTTDFLFVYRSPGHFLDVFRTYYGPVEKAFLALPESGQQQLSADILALIDRHNTADDGTMRVPGEYVEVVITKV